jgi:3-deoxy-D-arabino-heptulosonate 7-phosphate (DAHP) synthase
VKTILTMLAVVLKLSTGYALAGTDGEVKVTFDRFVAAQNAHDISAVRELLLDSPNFPG